MKLKKNVINIILLIIVCLILSLNISVNAKTWVWNDIRTLYETSSKEHVKEVIKGLSSQEIQNWRTEIESVNINYHDFENKKGLVDYIYGAFGTETNPWADDQDIAQDIEKWMNDVELEKNKEGEPEENEEELGNKQKEFENMTGTEISNWLNEHDIESLGSVEGFSVEAQESIKTAWKKTLKDDPYQNPRSLARYEALIDGKSEEEATNEADEAGKEAAGIDTPAGPSTGILGESNASGDHTAGEIISDANNFINAGKNEGNKIDTNNLQTASNTLYNILLSIGIVIAVIVGMYLGVKFMMSSAEDKAKVKESLIPYIAGCVVIFGAFIIWKLAILLLNGLS